MFQVAFAMSIRNSYLACCKGLTLQHLHVPSLPLRALKILDYPTPVHRCAAAYLFAMSKDRRKLWKLVSFLLSWALEIQFPCRLLGPVLLHLELCLNLWCVMMSCLGYILKNSAIEQWLTHYVDSLTKFSSWTSTHDLTRPRPWYRIQLPRPCFRPVELTTYFSNSMHQRLSPRRAQWKDTLRRCVTARRRIRDIAKAWSTGTHRGRGQSSRVKLLARLRVMRSIVTPTHLIWTHPVLDQGPNQRPPNRPELRPSTCLWTRPTGSARTSYHSCSASQRSPLVAPHPSCPDASDYALVGPCLSHVLALHTLDSSDPHCSRHPPHGFLPSGPKPGADTVTYEEAMLARCSCFNWDCSQEKWQWSSLYSSVKQHMKSSALIIKLVIVTLGVVSKQLTSLLPLDMLVYRLAISAHLEGWRGRIFWGRTCGFPFYSKGFGANALERSYG